MSRSRLVAAGLGLLMVLISVWQLENASSGLTFIHVQDGELPVTLISPEGEAGVNRPLVLIGHGAGGSRVIMQGYGLTLAHAGYNVALWDFVGHGGNLQPLPADGELVTDAEEALRIAAENGFPIDRTGILGHSMGSGAALTYGLLHPETMATIAISPVDRLVTEELPRNMLLMAGEYEASFIRNAAKLLLDAGGPGGDPQAGTARRIEIIPNVEHITILFSSTAHAAARSWLDEVFGSQPGAEDFIDRRMLWYLVGLVGTLLFFWSFSPLVDNLNDRIIETVDYSIWRRMGALTLGALGATGILYVLSQAGLNLTNLLGLLVGGYLLVWFAIAGALSIVLLGRMPGQMVRDQLGQF